MDTIVALATAAGRSAIGVIRLSGSRALEIVQSVVNDPQFQPQPSHAVLRSIRSKEQNSVLDKGLFTYFAAPNSYTGEDVVEISCHGSPVVLRQVVDLTLSLGGRLADPGEFTLRAVSNGKLDLIQAEAVRDLIEAQTGAAAQQAARQLMGELSLRLQPIEKRIIEVIVQLESALEFVEDDLPEVRYEELRGRLAEIKTELESLAATYSAGHLLQDGLKVTLAGRPNVGKSSLFNKLLERERAIVTEVPGTTRDTLTEALSIGGVPVLLTDTAGVRDSIDRIERMGVDRTRQAMADADMLLLVLDGSEAMTAEDQALISEVRKVQHVIALNKSDLPPSSEARLRDQFSNGAIEVSALTGYGIDRLCAAILAPFMSVDSGSTGLLITNARHYDLLKRAAGEMDSSLNLLDQRASEELVLVGLHNALRLVGQITGETTTEDILSEIFSTFCIGK